MAYSSDQYQAKKGRIKAAQKFYYQRTREARLSYQKGHDDKNKEQNRALKTNQHKYDWFPRDYNKEVAIFDRHTPGLFKDEWSGDDMVSLPYKNYICYLPDQSYKAKVSAKGVQQGRGRNEDVLNPDGFGTVVRDRITLQGTNKGFRLSKESKSIIAYTQTKSALSYIYDKRQVLSDGISTIPFI
ncbi:hypothetical protein PC110_g13774 [Phytophthora cactorum]|uniref:Uncharacterized protein n=1 Tax=Phytophthora cactorum TaxID=29920 RepID=A0A329S2J1_9STRA|nr:hypothetical protein PC110_g13774 [Phytophthora cactorum]